jgi:SOS-response transcriptional repressor LexA
MPGRRALDVLAFVVKFKAAHCGDSPSLEEIAAGVGVASRSTVLVHLAALERHGLITRPAARDARRIGIPGAVWTPPEGQSLR